MKEDLISKSELIELIGVKGNFTKSESTRYLNLLFDTISEMIKDGKKIQIRDFGTFNLMDQKSYTARNPKTGEAVNVPERKTIKFKPSKKLKMFLNIEDIDDFEGDDEDVE